MAIFSLTAYLYQIDYRQFHTRQFHGTLTPAQAQSTLCIPWITFTQQNFPTRNATLLGQPREDTRTKANAEQGITAQHRLAQTKIEPPAAMKPTKTRTLSPSTMSNVFPVHAQECGPCSMYAKPDKGYLVPYHSRCID